MHNWTNPQGVINGGYVFLTSFLPILRDISPSGYIVAEIWEVCQELNWNSRIKLEAVMGVFVKTLQRG